MAENRAGLTLTAPVGPSFFPIRIGLGCLFSLGYVEF